MDKAKSGKMSDLKNQTENLALTDPVSDEQIDDMPLNYVSRRHYDRHLTRLKSYSYLWAVLIAIIVFLVIVVPIIAGVILKFVIQSDGNEN